MRASRYLQRISLAITIALLASLSLSSCTRQIMSKEVAGELYLDAICPDNAFISSLENYTYEDTVTGYKAYIRTNIPTLKYAVSILDNPDNLWPEEVKADISVIADEYYSSINAAESALTLKSLKEMHNWHWPKPIKGSGTSATKIRSRLGLSTDKVSSCNGHRTMGFGVTADTDLSDFILTRLQLVDYKSKWDVDPYAGDIEIDGVSDIFLGASCAVWLFDTESQAVETDFSWVKGAVVFGTDYLTGLGIALVYDSTRDACFQSAKHEFGLTQ